MLVHLALAIREKAREHGIPIVENKPLAQARMIAETFTQDRRGTATGSEEFAMLAGALAGRVPLALAAVGLELPYDLAVARDGTIHFPDRSRILTVHPSTGRVRVRCWCGCGRLASAAPTAS